MASDDCVSAFSALDEAPLAPLYGSDFVVLGKRVLMSSFNAPFGSKIVFNSLKEIFPAQAQMVLMPSSNGIPLTLEAMTYSQIVEAVDLQIRSETYGILPLDKKLEFDNLKAQYESATNEAEKAGCLDLIKELVYTSVLLSLANASLKGFASYLDTHSGFQMMLLDNRKTYTADQGKVKGIAARAKRAKDRTYAKTSKPSAIPPRSAAGKIRKQISDVSEEDSDSSSTSMGISCHGKHTSSSDSNDDFDDGAYGKLPANTSLPEASLSTSADHASQGSLPNLLPFLQDLLLERLGNKSVMSLKKILILHPPQWEFPAMGNILLLLIAMMTLMMVLMENFLPIPLYLKLLSLPLLITLLKALFQLVLTTLNPLPLLLSLCLQLEAPPLWLLTILPSLFQKRKDSLKRKGKLLKEELHLS